MVVCVHTLLLLLSFWILVGIVGAVPLLHGRGCPPLLLCVARPMAVMLCVVTLHFRPSSSNVRRLSLTLARSRPALCEIPPLSPFLLSQSGQSLFGSHSRLGHPPSPLPEGPGTITCFRRARKKGEGYRGNKSHLLHNLLQCVGTKRSEQKFSVNRSQTSYP